MQCYNFVLCFEHKKKFKLKFDNLFEIWENLDFFPERNLALKKIIKMKREKRIERIEKHWGKYFYEYKKKLILTKKLHFFFSFAFLFCLKSQFKFHLICLLIFEIRKILQIIFPFRPFLPFLSLSLWLWLWLLFDLSYSIALVFVYFF